VAGVALLEGKLHQAQTAAKLPVEVAQTDPHIARSLANPEVPVTRCVEQLRFVGRVLPEVLAGAVARPTLALALAHDLALALAHDLALALALALALSTDYAHRGLRIGDWGLVSHRSKSMMKSKQASSS
jgi:hypothetical protein